MKPYLLRYASLLLFLLAASPVLMAQNDLNLALSKPGNNGSTATASVSSEEKTSTLGRYLNDGDHATRWASQYADDQSLVINLGSVQAIDRVRITWEQAYAIDFQLQVSANADFASYKVAQVVTGNVPRNYNGQFLNEYANLGLTGQYIRLVATKRRLIGGNFYGYSIYEFEVFGFSNVAGKNLALNQPATASNSEDGTLTPNNAFDDNLETRWSTRNGEYQSLVVDLGTSASVARVYLNWENAYAYAFVLQSAGSEADVQANRWTTFATYTNNQAYINEVAVTAAGRFFRVLAQKGYGGFSVREFALFAGTPLPVSLTSFTAVTQGAAVAVNWATASELNNAGFEVQRSTDGVGYTTLAKVAAAGNSQTAKLYRYLDAAPLRTLGYYRLKQTDVDGTVTYGPVVAVRPGESRVAAFVSVYPNPTTDLAIARWEAAAPSAGQWRLTNMLGQVVQQQAFEVQAGSNEQALDLRAYPAGSYVLTLQTAGQVLHRQLVQKK
jgi:hypothetical protein